MRTADLVRLLTLTLLWGGSFRLHRIVAPLLGTVISAEARVVIAGVALLGWQAVVGPLRLAPTSRMALGAALVLLATGVIVAPSKRTVAIVRRAAASPASRRIPWAAS